MYDKKPVMMAKAGGKSAAFKTCSSCKSAAKCKAAGKCLGKAK
jgi:hypothetical protein